MLEASGIRVHLPGMDQELTAAVPGLTQPEPALPDRDQVRVLRQVALLQGLVARHQDRGERIEGDQGEDPEALGDQQSRQQELPDRDAGRADGHQLVRAGQALKGQHGPEQDRERHQLLDQEGEVQQPHEQHQAEAHAGLAIGPAQQLDHVGHERDHRQAEDRDRDADQHLTGEIAGQGDRQPDLALTGSNVRGARRRRQNSGGRAPPHAGWTTAARVRRRGR